MQHTGFRFKDADGTEWWEKREKLGAYAWVFRSDGSGCCLTFTYV